MYEVVVIWYTGEKQVYEYETEQEANEIAAGYEMAFGNQISWVGVRKKI